MDRGGELKLRRPRLHIKVNHRSILKWPVPWNGLAIGSKP